MCVAIKRLEDNQGLNQAGNSLSGLTTLNVIIIIVIQITQGA